MLSILEKVVSSFRGQRSRATKTRAAVIHAETLEQRLCFAAATFIVDPELSSVTLAGMLDLLVLEEQAPGSLTTSYSGQIVTDYTPDSIQIQPGTFLDADDSGSWEPGDVPANYGGQALVLGQLVTAAVRDLSVGLTSTASPITDGAAELEGIILSALGGTFDYESPLGGVISSPLAGQTITANGPIGATISTDVETGIVTLTIPLDVTLHSDDLAGQSGNLFLTGSIVASYDPSLEPTTHAISGVVYNDKDGNGKKAAAEKGLAGVTLYLDLNQNGKRNAFEPTTVTNAKGAFTFADLDDGAYVIRTVKKSGYRVSQPNTGALQVTLNGANRGNVRIGLTTRGRISGTLYYDQVNNNRIDPGDFFGTKVAFYLDLNKNGKREKTEPVAKTNALGVFQFNNLAKGTYFVRPLTLNPSLFDLPKSAVFKVKLASGASVDSLAFLVKNVKDQR